jgi:hypothetical protein
MSLRLMDLDELVLTVRDKTSQSYILEAVNTYRGGAYRAAVISAWIAVAYDIISKIRELAGQGDPAASQFILQLDGAIQRNDITRLSVIEEQLLEIAHRDFEFLSRQEFENLLRLKRDRNICAHPAFADDEILFQPTAEITRAHIVHAILHLLQHRPMQGKSALNKILADIQRPSFPTEPQRIADFLSDKYLNRAKDALVRNLVIVLLKTLLRGDDPDFSGKEDQIIHSLITVSNSHRQIYELVMAEKLPEIVSSLTDPQLMSIFRLFGADPRCWNWLDSPTRIQVRELLNKTLTSPNLLSLVRSYEVFNAMNVGELSDPLMTIFVTLSPEDQTLIISENPRSEFADIAIDLYSNARTFRGAEALGERLILPMASHFQADHINRILETAMANNQIWDAGGTPDILVELFDATVNHLDETQASWVRFQRFVSEQSEGTPEDYFLHYHGLRRRLDEHGIGV